MLIFDIDGTLFDTRAGIFAALEDVFDKFNLGEFDRNVGQKYIGPPIRDSLMKYNSLSPEEAIKAVTYYRQIYIEKYIDRSLLYNGVIGTLIDLKHSGHKLAIATMKTKAQLSKLFQVVQLDTSLFSCICTAVDDGSLSKVEMIRAICSQCDSKELVVMIGDTEGDKMAADGAGVEFIGVTYGYGFTSEEKYDFRTINSISEIYNVANQVGGL